MRKTGRLASITAKAIGAWQRAARWVGQFPRPVSSPQRIRRLESLVWGEAAFFVIGPRPTMTLKSRVLALHIRLESLPCRLVRAAILELWEESGWQFRATQTTKRKPLNWSAFSPVRIWLRRGLACFSILPAFPLSMGFPKCGTKSAFPCCKSSSSRWYRPAAFRCDGKELQ